MQPIITENREKIIELCRQHHVRCLSVFGSAVASGSSSDCFSAVGARAASAKAAAAFSGFASGNFPASVLPPVRCRSSSARSARYLVAQVW